MGEILVRYWVDNDFAACPSSFLPSSSPPLMRPKRDRWSASARVGHRTFDDIHLVIDTGTVSVEARNEICIGLPDSQMRCRVTVLGQARTCTPCGRRQRQTEAVMSPLAYQNSLVAQAVRRYVPSHRDSDASGVVGVIHQVGESWSLSRMKRS
jgi:hypothetical protein